MSIDTPGSWLGAPYDDMRNLKADGTPITQSKAQDSGCIDSHPWALPCNNLTGDGATAAIANIMEKSRTRWLSTREVFDVITNYGQVLEQSLLRLGIQPRGGDVFCFNRSSCRRFREDGVDWMKRSNGRTLLEAHESFRVPHTTSAALHVYYGSSRDGSLLRRVYWRTSSEGCALPIAGPHSHRPHHARDARVIRDDLVLVHYLSRADAEASALEHSSRQKRGVRGTSPRKRQGGATRAVSLTTLFDVTDEMEGAVEEAVGITQDMVSEEGDGGHPRRICGSAIAPQADGNQVHSAMMMAVALGAPPGAVKEVAVSGSEGTVMTGGGVSYGKRRCCARGSSTASMVDSLALNNSMLLPHPSGRPAYMACPLPPPMTSAPPAAGSTTMQAGAGSSAGNRLTPGMLPSLNVSERGDCGVGAGVVKHEPWLLDSPTGCAPAAHQCQGSLRAPYIPSIWLLNQASTASTAMLDDGLCPSPGDEHSGTLPTVLNPTLVSAGQMCQPGVAANAAPRHSLQLALATPAPALCATPIHEPCLVAQAVPSLAPCLASDAAAITSPAPPHLDEPLRQSIPTAVLPEPSPFDVLAAGLGWDDTGEDADLWDTGFGSHTACGLMATGEPSADAGGVALDHPPPPPAPVVWQCPSSSMPANPFTGPASSSRCSMLLSHAVLGGCFEEDVSQGGQRTAWDTAVIASTASLMMSAHQLASINTGPGLAYYHPSTAE